MLQNNLLRRTVQFGVCAAVLVLWATPGMSAPAACVFAYKNAETLAKAGQLREAKTSMLKCAHPTCGGNVSRECGRRVAEIESDIPTIVPIVINEDGETVTDVSVTMDGEVIAARTDGRAVPVDAGRHEFIFRSGRQLLATVRTVIVQGQRNRTIEIALRSGRTPLAKSNIPATAAPPGLERASMVENSNDDEEAPAMAPGDAHSLSGRYVSTTTYVMGAAAALGVGGYFLTTYIGNRDAGQLEACRPNCDQATVDAIQNKFLAGKISLGVGLAALAGATYLYFTSDSSGRARSTWRRIGRRSTGWTSAPTASGGFAVFSGSF